MFDAGTPARMPRQYIVRPDCGVIIVKVIQRVENSDRSPLKAFIFVNVFTMSRASELFMGTKNSQRTGNRRIEGRKQNQGRGAEDKIS